MESYKTHKGDDEQFIVLLRILDGVNFLQEKPFRKIALTASLDHNVLDAATRRPVTPGSGTARFNATLVWACNRFYMRRMKMENIPIKVECFELLPSGNRCLIGCVVVAMRSVPQVPLIRTESIKPRWYRLVGIESERWRKRKPELNMIVMITDPKYLEPNEPIESPVMEDLSGNGSSLTEKQTVVYTNPSVDQLLGNVELLEERGLLQIGRKDIDTDLFLLTIVLKCGRHLDRLAPAADTFRLRYHLFGKAYPLQADRNEPGSSVFSVQEKISISIRSSLATLANYLEDALKIAVDLLTECDPIMARLEPGRVSPISTIGKSTIDFVGFLKERDLEEFIRKYESMDNTFEAVRSFPIHLLDGEEKDRATNEQLLVPSLKCKISLRFLAHDNQKAKEETNEKEEKEIDESTPTESSATEVRRLSPVEAETAMDEKKQPINLKDHTLAEEEEGCLSENIKTPATVPMDHPAATFERVDIATILLNTDQDLRDIRRTFAFNVRVGLVKFTSSPSPGLWQLTLQHTKADTPFTKLTMELMPDAVHPERIDFGDITLKLLFSTLPERVMEVIGSEPSKLTINGPHGMHLLARLDNASLLVGTREQQPSGVVVMVDGSSGEHVAIATIGCSLCEVGLNYNSQLTADAEKPIGTLCCHTTTDSGNRHVRLPFDENISYQLLEEQKAWMNEQREQFVDRLKEKERNHLQSNHWEAYRAEEEKKLTDRLAHADAMAAALEEARRTLKDRDHQETHEGRLEGQFRDQLDAIRSKALRLEREAEAQIEATRKQCRELQDQLAVLSADQQHLLDTNLKVQRELDEERRLRVQEVSELQQTVEDISASKLRYKEQWAKLTRKAYQLEQELAKARTPYYQPSTREQRKSTNRREEGSQMSMISMRRRGAGDCSSCSFQKPPDSCQ